MARVALEDAIAELDNVAEGSHKDATTFRKCSAIDLSLVEMIAPKVEHESVLRRRLKCVALTFQQRCICTPAHVVRTLPNVVTSALAQVFSQRVNRIESQRAFN